MPTRSFTDYVRKLEKDPKEKAALDAARAALRRKLDGPDEQKEGGSDA